MNALLPGCMCCEFHSMSLGLGCLICAWAPVLLRFCISNVLNFGTSFFDLVLQCTELIENSIRVSFEPPSPSNMKFAKDMLQAAMEGRRKLNLHGSEHPESRQASLFLSIFNGNWKSNVITHHCSYECPCKGSRSLGKLAGEVFAEVVLGARPTVPALSRWLKCASTAKWFLPLAEF